MFPFRLLLGLDAVRCEQPTLQVKEKGFPYPAPGAESYHRRYFVVSQRASAKNELSLPTSQRQDNSLAPRTQRLRRERGLARGLETQLSRKAAARSEAGPQRNRKRKFFRCESLGRGDRREYQGIIQS